MLQDYDGKPGQEFGRLWGNLDRPRILGTSTWPPRFQPPPPPNPHPFGTHPMHRELRDKFKIPTYDGKWDFDSLEDWLCKLENYFKIMHGMEPQMVLLSTM